jgi:hypothetical protein
MSINYQMYLTSHGAEEINQIWLFHGHALGATPRSAAHSLMQILDANSAKARRESLTPDYKTLRRLADHR